MTKWLPIADVPSPQRHFLALGFGYGLPVVARLVRQALDEHHRERHAEAGIQWVLAIATIAGWSCAPILPRDVERRGLDGVDRWSALAVGDVIEWMDASGTWHGPERITRFEIINGRHRLWFGEGLGVMDYAMRDVRLVEPSPHDVYRD
jgi:hypothetical protein